MARGTGLQKKMYEADEHLAAILDIRVGAKFSNAELIKGVHKYIKKKHLKIEN